MKRGLLVLALGLTLSAPAWAQTATETLTKAATDAAVQAVDNEVVKATGSTDAAATQGNKKVKKARDKNVPNWGQSQDHRQDGQRGHKGKSKKNKD